MAGKFSVHRVGIVKETALWEVRAPAGNLRDFFSRYGRKEIETYYTKDLAKYHCDRLNAKLAGFRREQEQAAKAKKRGK